MNKKVIAYCAGPQYSPEEKRGMLAITRRLEKSGFDTYLSSRDSLEYLMPRLMSHPDIQQSGLHDLLPLMHQIVFAIETFQVIRRCDSLVLNLNGRVPDEGSVFKASLAFSAGRPVTIYKNDNRSVFHGYDNSMVTGLTGGLPIVKRINRIPVGVSNAMRKWKTSGGHTYKGDNITPYVHRVIDFGETAWVIFKEMELLNTNDDDLYRKLVRFKHRCEKAEGMRHLQRLRSNNE